MFLQFSNDPNVKASSHTLTGVLSKILHEHERFFHSPREISLSVLCLFAFFLARKSFSPDTKQLLMYFIILVFSLALISHSTSAKYGIIYFPYIATICGIAYYELMKKQYVRWAFNLTLCVYVVIQVVYTVNWVNLGKLRGNQYADLKELIPQNSKVIGPDSFLFEGLTDYDYYGYWGFIYSYTDYKKCKASELDFIDFVDKYKFDYMIFDKGIPLLANLKTFDLITILEKVSYEVVLDSPDYILLKKSIKI